MDLQHGIELYEFFRIQSKMSGLTPWALTQADLDANRQQFFSAGPVQGKLSGAAARGVLIKSQLPSQTLAQVDFSSEFLYISVLIVCNLYFQIWALSDIDKDGFLTEFEFSVAMKLTRNCLAGLPLPPTLPPSMMSVCGSWNFPPWKVLSEWLRIII